MCFFDLRAYCVVIGVAFDNQAGSDPDLSRKTR
jgi:hypothetical protein